MAEEKLEQLRNRIDALDQQILDLISQRARCAQAVARVKSEADPCTVFYRPEREARVLRNIMKNNVGPLDDEEMARLFREIMSACLALECPVKVAFLGPVGTFTQQASLKHFGHSAVCVPMTAIDDVFREVAAGAANYGVVPIENSTEGVVSHTLDNFMDSSLKICGEVVLRIHQNLLVSGNTERDKITRIYSHAQSFAQCRKWLDAHWPMAERVAVSSNGEAAQRVKEEKNCGAIAGDMAADLYGLVKMAEKIEDHPDNSTRFLIIGSQPIPPSGDDKTSVLISVRNQPGALHRILEPFHTHNVDLTQVETRPSRAGLWNYVFFVDFEGHQEDPAVRKVLEILGKRANDFRVLGSYPKGVL